MRGWSVKKVGILGNRYPNSDQTVGTEGKGKTKEVQYQRISIIKKTRTLEGLHEDMCSGARKYGSKARDLGPNTKEKYCEGNWSTTLRSSMQFSCAATCFWAQAVWMEQWKEDKCGKLRRDESQSTSRSSFQ